MSKTAIIDVSVEAEVTEPDVPILWQPLPHLTWEDGSRRRIRLKDYINDPVSQARFELHPDYTLPDGWNLRTNGNLLYNAVLGQTIELRFKATRGTESAYSDILRITRQQAFISTLVPNRINLGLAFNNTEQQIYIYNTTDVDVRPVRDYVNLFDIEGNEIIADAADLSDVNPQGRSGIGWDGTYKWVCGHYDLGSGGELRKINPDGTLNATYTYTGGEIESIAFDGTYMWGLDISQYKLRKFNLSGVEQSGEITLPRAAHLGDYTGYFFTLAQYGLAFGDGHFWIVQDFITAENWIFCCTTSGTRVRSRDVQTEHTVSGVTYNPTTRNLWWILDREDGEGARYGVLRAQQI